MGIHPSIRAFRPGRLFESVPRVSVNRTQADCAEIKRRVKLYAAQYKRTGKFVWEPHKNRQKS